MKTNLTQSITIHSAYGVEVEYTDGEIFTVDSKIERYNEPLKKVSVFRAIHDIEQGKAKLLLHSLDKLTQEIDGKVGIVELFKICMKGKNIPNDFFDDYKIKIVDDAVNLEIGAFTFGYDLLDNSFVLVLEDEILTVFNQLELFNYLLANHYNVFGLSSEYFKEKSEIKERGIIIIDKSKNFEKDLDKYENQFSTNECDCIGKENFAYERTVANGEVWHCKEHNVEIMTDEEPKEDNY